MALEDILSSILGGGGGGGGMGAGPGPGMPGPGGMPPTGPPPPVPGPPGGLPEIPVGDSSEMGNQVKSLSTQLSHIGAQLMSRGMHDAAISCAKAVKELDKVPQLIQEHSQQNSPPPNMGVTGMSGMNPNIPFMPPTGPPPLPGVG